MGFAFFITFRGGSSLASSREGGLLWGTQTLFSLFISLVPRGVCCGGPRYLLAWEVFISLVPRGGLLGGTSRYLLASFPGGVLEGVFSSFVPSGESLRMRLIGALAVVSRDYFG